jgi:nucleolar protein 12
VRFRSVPVAPVAVTPGADFRAMARAAFIAKSFRGDGEGVRGAMNAYVVCGSARAAAAALALNGQRLGAHHTLRVDRAGRPDGARPQYDPKRSIFVGQLHYEATEDELRAVCAARVSGGAASVEAVRIVRDAATARGKGIAYVLFRERVHVAEALGLHCVPLRGRPMRVARCVDARKAPPVDAAAAARKRVQKPLRRPANGGAATAAAPPPAKRPRASDGAAPAPAPASAAAARPAHMGASGADVVLGKAEHKQVAVRRKGVKARRNREERTARRAAAAAAAGGAGGAGGILKR